MTLLYNNGSRQSTQVFENDKLSSKVDFRLIKSSEHIPVGQGSNCYTTRPDLTTLTEFNIQYFNLDHRDLLKFLTRYHSTKGRAIGLLFDDFSDNYVFPWSNDDLSLLQYGALIPVQNGGATTFQGYKIYEAGGQYIGWRKISFYPDDAIVSVDNVPVNPTELDRNTGIFTLEEQPVELFFTANIYYTEVKLNADPTFTTSNGYGLDYRDILNNTTDVDINRCDQEYSGTLSFTELVADTGARLTNTFNPLEPQKNISLDLQYYSSEATYLETYRSREWQHRTDRYFASQLNPTKAAQGSLTVVPANLQHKQLIPWITLFRATGGGYWNSTLNTQPILP